MYKFQSTLFDNRSDWVSAIARWLTAGRPMESREAALRLIEEVERDGFFDGWTPPEKEELADAMQHSVFALS